MSTPIIEVFRQGAALDSICRLTGRHQHDIEEAMRAELRALAHETRQAVTPAGEAPAVAPTKPAPRTPPVARAHRKTPDAVLSGYPEALRDPRAERQRACYDALTMQPMTLAELADALDTDSGGAWGAVESLRKKNLAIGSDTTPVVWSLVQPR